MEARSLVRENIVTHPDLGMRMGPKDMQEWQFRLCNQPGTVWRAQAHHFLNVCRPNDVTWNTSCRRWWQQPGLWNQTDTWIWSRLLLTAWSLQVLQLFVLCPHLGSEGSCSFLIKPLWGEVQIGKCPVSHWHGSFHEHFVGRMSGMVSIFLPK